MRGKGRNGMYIVQLSGITPAYAGKSINQFATDFFLKDHPRLCGEKSLLYPSAQQQLGSPPPMRGKGSAYRFCQRLQRITPAYAGKSKEDKNGKGSQAGSPPPMRGKGVSGFSLTSVSRITPAYAGKSLTS